MRCIIEVIESEYHIYNTTCKYTIGNNYIHIVLKLIFISFDYRPLKRLMRRQLMLVAAVYEQQWIPRNKLSVIALYSL